MILNTGAALPHAIDVLDSHRCQAISAELNEFENSIFGPDFHWTHEAVQAWARTRCFFSAALRERLASGHRKLIASASIFITHSASREALFRGEIVDHELEPWFAGQPGSVPTLYASSMVSVSGEHRRVLYGSLFMELSHYLTANRLKARSGFAIASTLDGFRHLWTIGFQPVPKVRYKGKYDFFLVNPPSARNRFWQRLLHLEPFVADGAAELRHALPDPAWSSSHPGVLPQLRAISAQAEAPPQPLTRPST